MADDPGATGQIASGTVYAGYAPAGAFSLTQGRRSVARQSVYGWAGQYPGTSTGAATFSLTRFPSIPLVVLLEVLGWVVLAGALLGWSIPRRRARPGEES